MSASMSRIRIASASRAPRALLLHPCRRRGPQHCPSVSQQQTAGVSSTARNLPSHEVVKLFYDSFNNGDFETLQSLVSDDCSYHDMIYTDPFVGRKAVLSYFKKARDVVGGELKFVVEDITTGDPSRVGVTWHVENSNGVQTLFSRGCSFYTINDKGQITSARDLVEPALKPGSATLRVLALLGPLLKDAKAESLPSALPIAAAGVWAFAAAYFSYIFFSTSAPGLPVLQTPPEVLQEIFYESLNLFYINVFLADWGLAPVPSVACPPVSEAIFNFVNAWGMMFLPLILTDSKGAKVNNKTAWWLGIMFLTNVFFIPYLAFRAAPEPFTSPRPPPPGPTPQWAPALGAFGATVGAFSIWWALGARPEYGDLAARWQYFTDEISSNRAFFAFVVDSGLYCVWQWEMMQRAPAALRALPFFGLATWLATGCPRSEDEEEVF